MGRVTKVKTRNERRLENWRWQVCLYLVAALFALLPYRTVSAADVSFRWSVLADSTEGMQGLDFSGSPIVFSGTGLQIYVEHLKNCHIYLFLLDSGQNLTPLYPAENGYYNYGFPRGPKLIPPGDQSFTFVPPAGTETLLLIGSAERQFQLEKLTEEFDKNPDQMGQQKLLLDLLETILKDQEKNARAAERRKQVSVKYKTAEGIKEKQFQATKVTISDLYARRLLIDHR